MGAVACSVRRPDRVDLIGSYLLHTLAKPMCNVDVAVQIPEVPFAARRVQRRGCVPFLCTHVFACCAPCASRLACSRATT